MKIYKLSFLSYIPIISGLNFQLFSCIRAPGFPQASHPPDSLQNQKRDKTGIANIFFRSTDGGQTWQDIREGLPGKLEEAGFSGPERLEFVNCFIGKTPGRHKVFLLLQL